MKLKAEDIRQAKTIEILGNEDWLRLIYDSFKSSPDERRDSVITGTLTISPDNYGVFEVRGSVEFVPFVSCSRCEKAVPWEIKRNIKIRFIEPRPLEPDEVERDLESTDMDTYYLDEAGYLDLELVINDHIQTAIPFRTVKLEADGKTCKICRIDATSPVVFQSSAEPKKNPFEILKGLKLPPE